MKTLQDLLETAIYSKDMTLCTRLRFKCFVGEPVTVILDVKASAQKRAEEAGLFLVIEFLNDAHKISEYVNAYVEEYQYDIFRISRNNDGCINSMTYRFYDNCYSKQGGVLQ